MPSHNHLHRREHHAAADLPDSFASAVSDAFDALDPFAQAAATTDQPAAAAPSTMWVTVTAPKTFDGEIGGYSTKGKPTPTNAAAQPTDNAGDESAPSSTTSSHHKAVSTGMPSAIAPPKTTIPTSVALLAATGAISSSHNSVVPSQTAVSAAGASSTSAPVATTGGMSVAGKAGMAIGIILLIGAVLSLALYAFKRKREANDHDRLDNEKDDMFGAAAREPSIRTNATAPRLSLRPVTQFLPNLGERRQSRGNALAMTAAPMGNQSEKPSAWNRSAQDANRNNPFGNHAESIENNANGPAAVHGMASSGQAVAAGAAAGAVIGLARGASKRGNGPKPMDLTQNRGPPSPSGTEFSDTADSVVSPTQTKSGAAIAAAGGPPNTAVHRVQLDFKPSMEDELELRAGQLIRLLHEYDDGWALCIRLDRSQQGVVPRTCLSTRPVKPRPQQNGPRGPPPPGMRVPQGPMNQPMRQGPPRPMSPAGARPMTPNGPQPNRPMTPTGPQYQRPMTPTGPQYQRPMTPNGQQPRPQSPSAAQMQGRRNSPPGQGPMGQAGPGFQPGGGYQVPQGPPMGAVGRKPVPGQAL